jgi:hypothetical protein
LPNPGQYDGYGKEIPRNTDSRLAITPRVHSDQNPLQRAETVLWADDSHIRLPKAKGVDVQTRQRFGEYHMQKGMVSDVAFADQL